MSKQRTKIPALDDNGKFVYNNNEGDKTMTQYKPYYRSKPVTVQARKEKRDATIMTIAVVIFTAFAMLGIGFAFSVLVRYVTSLIL
jgi:hypothetical protein|tara:strand:+ start:105 stop:362 length:258 start_codon:yes stop_codon:yes gene_type:complete